jgi:hypothetical protein
MLRHPSLDVKIFIFKISKQEVDIYRGVTDGCQGIFFTFIKKNKIKLYYKISL